MTQIIQLILFIIHKVRTFKQKQDIKSKKSTNKPTIIYLTPEDKEYQTIHYENVDSKNIHNYMEYYIN